MQNEINDLNFHYYDLAVIGGGPAGTLAAALAAKAGLSTIILEKSSYPRVKICGGFMSARSISLLPKDLRLSSLPSESIYQVSIIKKRQPYIYNSKTRLGIVIEREQLDHLMAKYACSNGAVIMEGHSLQKITRVENNKEKFRPYLLETGNSSGIKYLARYVIAADGAAGRTAKLTGLRRDKNSPAGWGMSKIIKARSNVAETGAVKFYPLPFLGGMGWSFSGPDWTNHGVGGLFGRKGLSKAYNRIFPGEPDNIKPQSWPLPFFGPMRKPAAGNLLLTGDAAGLIDPFSGEGLYNAFKSSILAVGAISAAEKNNREAGSIYSKIFKQHFRSGFTTSLAGAFLLHALSITNPSALPHAMAALMLNRLWFNRNIDDFPRQI
ncbi:MAG: FAD-dependent monooxygenase [Bacillota bacterium]